MTTYTFPLYSFIPITLTHPTPFSPLQLRLISGLRMYCKIKKLLGRTRMNCKTNITKRGTIDHMPNKLQHSPLSPSDKHMSGLAY